MTTQTHTILAEDFPAFETTGPDARWQHVAVGPFVADDGAATVSGAGLRVTSAGVNPATGEPAFTKTVPPEDRNGGLPGFVDHLKWFAMSTAQASSGFAGFDAVPGHELRFRATMSARTFGVANHPFGAGVADPAADLRLAAASMNAVDQETATVFDFFVTGITVYAFYERLPTKRAELGNYAAFSCAIPVATRSPGDWNELAIGYDRRAGTAVWSVDGREVYRIDRIGFLPPDTEHIVLDHGGEEQLVELRQLNCGMGLVSLLDARLPGLPALVRLSHAEGFYRVPGSAAPQEFLDDTSADGHRLFGQGAELGIAGYTVTSAPVEG
ncbi:DUF6081 family protein [Nocardia sp. NPDC057353]|uniref:DUF6081 family protein n=1 Tax=Nocardia sp. NPDC057353 TaxID=3346104 RepID=UPI00362F38FC